MMRWMFESRVGSIIDEYAKALYVGDDCIVPLLVCDPGPGHEQLLDPLHTKYQYLTRHELYLKARLAYVHF